MIQKLSFTKMECYTSDSSDSDSREQKTLDLSNQLLETVSLASELDSIVDEKNCAESYELLLLYNNRIKTLPETLNRFSNLKILDVSNNRLTALPDVFKNCPLSSLIARHNQLTNESLPKSFLSARSTLRELNLSGNQINFFPEQVLELGSLKYLYLGGNNITNIPKDVWKLYSLQILSLGGNQIVEVPESVGRLTGLQALVLSDNLIELLPASIANLKQLRSLLIHKNRLKTLPTQIIKLKCLAELSLRDNPLVVRFVSDMTLDPPSLLELAGRTIKLHEIPVRAGEVPVTLTRYLSAAQCCVNPKCKDCLYLPPNSSTRSAVFQLDGKVYPQAYRHMRHNILVLWNSDASTVRSKLTNLLRIFCRCPWAAHLPSGVFFDNRVEHIKFVDFCGKYRIPLLQYLCSSKCITGSWESREVDGSPHPHLMRKVLLG